MRIRASVCAMLQTSRVSATMLTAPSTLVTGVLGCARAQAHWYVRMPLLTRASGRRTGSMAKVSLDCWGTSEWFKARQGANDAGRLGIGRPYLGGWACMSSMKHIMVSPLQIDLHTSSCVTYRIYTCAANVAVFAGLVSR